MSSMLEQAIVDAQALREAALKNAEQALQMLVDADDRINILKSYFIERK